MEKLSPQLRHQLAQFQQLQQQAQALMTQRQQLELLLKETEHALEELQRLPADAVVYRSVGGLLVRADKKEVEQRLSEEKETLDLRVKTVARQQDRVIERLREMQEKLDQALKGGEQAQGVGG
jgi:prefoldin beta subunit